MDTPYALGDLVVWKGIELVVIDIKDNGDLETLSPTLRVTAPPTDFTPSFN